MSKPYRVVSTYTGSISGVSLPSGIKSQVNNIIIGYRTSPHYPNPNLRYYLVLKTRKREPQTPRLDTNTLMSHLNHKHCHSTYLFQCGNCTPLRLNSRWNHCSKNAYNISLLKLLLVQYFLSVTRLATSVVCRKNFRQLYAPNVCTKIGYDLPANQSDNGG